MSTIFPLKGKLINLPPGSGKATLRMYGPSSEPNTLWDSGDHIPDEPSNSWKDLVSALSPAPLEQLALFFTQINSPLIDPPSLPCHTPPNALSDLIKCLDQPISPADQKACMNALLRLGEVQPQLIDELCRCVNVFEVPFGLWPNLAPSPHRPVGHSFYTKWDEVMSRLPLSDESTQVWAQVSQPDILPLLPKTQARLQKREISQALSDQTRASPLQSKL